MNDAFLILLLAFMWLPSLSLAEDTAKPLPKFEEMLPSEHFFNKGPLPVGHTYGFATNKTLEEIKKLLLKKLGEGWDFEIAPPEVLKEMNKGGDIQMESVGEIKHKDYMKYSIGVTLVSMPDAMKKELKDYTRMLSIVTVDKDIAKKLKSKR